MGTPIAAPEAAPSRARRLHRWRRVAAWAVLALLLVAGVAAALLLI